MAAVLEEAVNEALPVFYGRAVEENSVAIIGHPQVEVKEFSDGGSLAFTAEVDVRPEFELPDYHGLPVTVDDAEVTDEADRRAARRAARPLRDAVCGRPPGRAR